MTPAQKFPNVELVDGYSWNDEAGNEVLGAVFADGTLAACFVGARYTVNFNKAGRVWSKVESFPDNAEWIGNYPADMKAA